MVETATAPQNRGRPEGPPRLGPRPLALHLTAAALSCAGSRAALPLLKSGSLPWRPEAQHAANELQARLASVEPDAFGRALDSQLQARLSALAAGILAYRRHPYQRRLADPPVLWAEGTTRLLDYGALAGLGAGAPVVLVVPSLINRAYILDLEARTSLLRWLAEQGLRPLLVDWDAPGPVERGFTLTDYVVGRLEAALDASLAEGGPRPLLLGYCMGGLLALPLALRRTHDLGGLVLLATPWDFHAGGAAQGAVAAWAALAFAPLLDLLGELPVDLIQALFAALDPQQVPRKFISFARLDPTSSRAEAFVALEDWLNDGVALAAPVARECLAGWYGRNTPVRGEWRIAGRPVDPARLALPSLCVIPASDRIVPPGSAVALATAIPRAERMTPPVGHIGMVVGSQAREKVWAPLLTWLRARAQAEARS